MKTRKGNEQTHIYLLKICWYLHNHFEFKVTCHTILHVFGVRLK